MNPYKSIVLDLLHCSLLCTCVLYSVCQLPLKKTAGGQSKRLAYNIFWASATVAEPSVMCYLFCIQICSIDAAMARMDMNDDTLSMLPFLQQVHCCLWVSLLGFALSL